MIKKKLELKTASQYKLLEAGCDEAGRGCFAGPVFAAAVILPNKFYHPLLNDSKQIKSAIRYELRKVIEDKAVAFAVAKVEVAEIDRINILKASQKAMHLALDTLPVQPEYIVIDGNYFIAYKQIPHSCVVKGDAIYANIAAASILAKTYRDDYMMQLHEQYPQYHWIANKGYGTLEHRIAMEKYGLSEHHRRSFKLHNAQLNLF